MPAPFDRERLQRAFELLGEDLADRDAFIELAVYGGGAVMMQFEWRRSTEDVDAVVREGFDEALLAPSVRRVAERLDLDADWLNNAVGMFTPRCARMIAFSSSPAPFRQGGARDCGSFWPRHTTSWP